MHRRDFLGLFASTAAGVLVRKARAEEVPALVGQVSEAEPEVQEYATAEVGAWAYASVRGRPLRLEKNHGFRYVARGKYGVRLVLARPFERCFAFLQPYDDEKPMFMAIAAEGPNFVEARAFALDGTEIILPDFHVCVREILVR